MSAEILVEPFSGDEAAMVAIAALHLQIRTWQREVGQAKFFNGIEDSQPDLRDLVNRYIVPGGNFWVAREEGAGDAVGFVAIRRDSERTATLKRLAVLPQYHGRGIGSQLVATAVEWAREAGFDRVELETGYYEQARGVYERHGFEIVGEDAANEDILMALTFTPPETCVIPLAD